MRRETETASWETFQEKVKKLRLMHSKESSPLLFRGQGNSEWPLTTTLERSGALDMLFSEYYSLICSSLGPEVSTYAKVNVPAYDPKFAVEGFSNINLLNTYQFPDRPLYQYIAYLRHFGFPSPMLDWSQSPFVAVFFAFRDASVNGKPEKRSIYVYCEMPEGVKSTGPGELAIRRIGPYVPTHERHFRQRCDYTICGSFDRNYEQWRFQSHQEVFAHSIPNQDFLWKFDILSSERVKILNTLSDYNLNAFSLFGSEESLLETMWFREYVSRIQD